MGDARYFSLSLSLFWTVYCPSWQWPYLLLGPDAQQLHPPWCQREPRCLTLVTAIAPLSGSASHPRAVRSSCFDHLCVTSSSHLASQLCQYLHKPMIISLPSVWKEKFAFLARPCLIQTISWPRMDFWLCYQILYNSSTGLRKNWYWLTCILVLAGYLTYSRSQGDVNCGWERDFSPSIICQVFFPSPPQISLLASHFNFLRFPSKLLNPSYIDVLKLSLEKAKVTQGPSHYFK